MDSFQCDVNGIVSSSNMLEHGTSKVVWKYISERKKIRITLDIWEYQDIRVVAWDFQQCGMCDQQSFRSACAYAQYDQSFCQPLEYSECKDTGGHHLVFLSLKGGCTGSSESTLVKMPHYWKSHSTAHIEEC